MATPETMELGKRALAMTFERAAEILTWADEPDLIRESGQPVPAFDPRDVAAARLFSAWESARELNRPQ